MISGVSEVHMKCSESISSVTEVLINLALYSVVEEVCTPPTRGTLVLLDCAKALRSDINGATAMVSNEALSCTMQLQVATANSTVYCAGLTCCHSEREVFRCYGWEGHHASQHT